MVSASRRTLLAATILFVSVVIVPHVTYAAPPPSVTTVTPGSGPEAGGTPVTVTGTNFLNGATVTFGGSPATGVTFVGATQIDCNTPAGTGIVDVVVTNPDTKSATLTNGFTYVPPPTVSAVNPASAPEAGGTTVTITGTNFVNGATVTFGGNPATGVTFVNATQLDCDTPAGTGTVDVVVTNPDTQSDTLAGGFTYDLPPTVAAVNPANGPQAGGTAVTITGTDFVDGATVTFDGNPAVGVTFVNAAQIDCDTPAGTGTVDLVVTNPDTQSDTLAGAFTYDLPPTVAAVNPANGPEAGGTAVTITGTDFVNGATVSFGGNPATGVTFVNATQIDCDTPAGTGTVDVVVTNPDTQSDTLAGAFTYDLAPTVSAVNPGTGPEAGSTAVTITGTDFVDGATVTFDGNPAAGVTFVNATQIDCDTPPGTGSVDVVVANPDAQSDTLAAGFVYTSVPPPTVSAVNPGNGPEVGGTAMAITGTDFVNGATVTFGVNPATGVTFVNAAQIDCDTPAGTGTVDVVVTNPDTQFDTLAGAFTYDLPPTVSAVNPGNGPEAGGTAVSITGTDFVDGATVTFDGNPPTGVTFVNAAQIDCDTPAGAGTVDVVVTNPDTQSDTLAGAFTYDPPPTVSAVNPANGPEVGGTAVSVTGTDFVDGVTVTFGGNPATAVTFVNATEITCDTPPGTGTVDVVLTNPDTQSDTLAGSFTYTSALPPTVSAVNPGNGPQAGGTAVSVTGTDFVDGATVTFGGVPATGVTFVNATEITCNTPGGTGTVDVVVTNPDTQSDTLAGGFVFDSTETLTLVDVAGPLDVGATQSVTWVSSGITNLLIELSRDGGSSWEVVVASTSAAAGSYVWTVTGPGSVDCLLRISDASDGDPWDESGAAFTIAAIAVTSPAGGEVWLTGSLQSITWQAVAVVSVRIEVSRDGGGTWDEIVASTDGTAGFSTWMVSGPESGACRVRVSDAADGVPAGVSPADFRIGPPEEAEARPFLGDGCVSAGRHGGGRLGTPASSPALIGTWLLCLAYALRKRRGRPLLPGMAEEA